MQRTSGAVNVDINISNIVNGRKPEEVDSFQCLKTTRNGDDKLTVEVKQDLLWPGPLQIDCGGESRTCNGPVQ